MPSDQLPQTEAISVPLGERMGYLSTMGPYGVKLARISGIIDREKNTFKLICFDGNRGTADLAEDVSAKGERMVTAGLSAFAANKPPQVVLQTAHKVGSADIDNTATGGMVCVEVGTPDPNGTRRVKFAQAGANSIIRWNGDTIPRTHLCNTLHKRHKDLLSFQPTSPQSIQNEDLLVTSFIGDKLPLAVNGQLSRPIEANEFSLETGEVLLVATGGMKLEELLLPGTNTEYIIGKILNKFKNGTLNARDTVALIQHEVRAITNNTNDMGLALISNIPQREVSIPSIQQPALGDKSKAKTLTRRQFLSNATNVAAAAIAAASLGKLMSDLGRRGSNTPETPTTSAPIATEDVIPTETVQEKLAEFQPLYQKLIEIKSLFGIVPNRHKSYIPLFKAMQEMPLQPDEEFSISILSDEWNTSGDRLSDDFADRLYSLQYIPKSLGELSEDQRNQRQVDNSDLEKIKTVFEMIAGVSPVFIMATPDSKQIILVPGGVGYVRGGQELTLGIEPSERELLITMVHELQHLVDFNWIFLSQYIEKKEFIAYHQANLDEAIGVFKEWASNDYKLVKAGNTEHLLSSLYNVDKNGNIINLYLNETIKCEQLLGVDHSVFNHHERVNRTIHALIKNLMSDDEAKKQSIMQDESSQALLQFAFDELIHIFVGPVQNPKGGMADTISDMDQDILTLPLARVQLARIRAFFKLKMDSIEDIGILKRALYAKG